MTEWIPLLRAAGHEAVHWLEVGDPRAPDKALMQWAIANRFAVFTHDLDFGTMLILSGADGPSVLQVRCLNVLSEAICTLVLSLLKTYGAVIEKGALVVADEESKMPHALPGADQGCLIVKRFDRRLHASLRRHWPRRPAASARHA